MEDWQKKYNAFFNSLAVESLVKTPKIFCKNCGCEFYDHRYWYAKNKNKTECHGCQDCKWFEPMGTSIDKVLMISNQGIIN